MECLVGVKVYIIIIIIGNMGYGMGFDGGTLGVTSICRLIALQVGQAKTGHLLQGPKDSITIFLYLHSPITFQALLGKELELLQQNRRPSIGQIKILLNTSHAFMTARRSTFWWQGCSTPGKGLR